MNTSQGNHRFKFFRRPVMPRTSAVPSNVLLATTATQNPLEPVDEVVSSPTREVEVQTIFRESEAQTVPYAPPYVLRPGEKPRILLMANLTTNNGLPIGPAEATMVQFALQKRDLEDSLPPFTDEASLNLRKKLMEQQELREMRVRENEIDAQRELRIEQLEQALVAREETSEFATAQRVENLRVRLMEERDKRLQQLRNKRVKVLRRLVQNRAQVDSALSDSRRRDIIKDYFDKGSATYAPRARDGQPKAVSPEKLDVTSRTATLMQLNNVNDLEKSIPNDLREANLQAMTQTSLFGSSSSTAAEKRLTSAAQRDIRNAKRDVDTMSKILTSRKKKSPLSDLERPTSSIAMPESVEKRSTSALIQNRPKPRPPTPDLTRNRDEAAMEEAEEYEAAVILLQRLIRGRAAQNNAYEGRFRRSELIAELRAAAEEKATQPDSESADEETISERRERILLSGIHAAIGGITSTLISKYVEESVSAHNIKNDKV